MTREDSFQEEHKDSPSELRTLELRWAEGPKTGTSLADAGKERMLVRCRWSEGEGDRCEMRYRS